ncbi:acyltransferase family protein [Clostridium perfringens]|uniref:acyltransferase family protein n=3 Tax=Clostridium perfringens TaxID=1502 RepID=UPI001A25C111|nr:acyltransferase family protein [Clostridium perfringens]HAT4224184.1 acyltransferase [Clostridium perfringens]
MKNKIKERNSSLEILRIFSMILIIAHHYSVHGYFNLSEQSLTLNKIIVQVLSLGGKLGVNCFILITGYFLIKSKFSFKKLFFFIAEVYFYSISLFFIFIFLGLKEFSFKNFIIASLPITFNGYWFVTIYIIMYMFSSYINKFIYSLNKLELFKFIALGIFLWSFIPTFILVSPGFSNLAWFIILYTIAAYCRLYPNNIILSYKVNLIIVIITYSITVFSVIVFDLIGTKIKLVGDNATIFMAGNRLPIAICSISLFLVFKNLRVKSNKFINTISATTFGIYLIHDNTYVRPFLWNNILKNSEYLNSNFLVIHAIVSITIVFIICSIIDYLRKKLIEKPLLELISRNEDKFIKLGFYINNLFNKLMVKLRNLELKET